ncbi:hypothetical protein ACWFRB_01060 [Rhodococcus sp. NPDC055112]
MSSARAGSAEFSPAAAAMTIATAEHTTVSVHTSRKDILALADSVERFISASGGENKTVSIV